MSRAKTPTNILELKGAFKKNPDRARPHEPKPEGELRKTPPKYLSDKEKACWREIVRIAPPGVLTSSDPIAVEVASVLLAEFREVGADMPPAMLGRLMTLLGKLGLDPSGRAGLVVHKPKTNKFS